jgi:hypothetical protein
MVNNAETEITITVDVKIGAIFDGGVSHEDVAHLAEMVTSVIRDCHNFDSVTLVRTAAKWPIPE